MTPPSLHADMDDRLRARRRRLVIASIAAAAIVVVAIGWVVMTLHPMPPRAVTMVTGPEGGSYHEFGKRYREIFARAGIDLRLVPSEGGGGKPPQAPRPPVGSRCRLLAGGYRRQRGVAGSRVAGRGFAARAATTLASEGLQLVLPDSGLMAWTFVVVYGSWLVAGVGIVVGGWRFWAHRRDACPGCRTLMDKT